MKSTYFTLKNVRSFVPTDNDDDIIVTKPPIEIHEEDKDSERERVRKRESTRKQPEVSNGISFIYVRSLLSNILVI